MGFKVLKETEDKFIVYNPESQKEEEHPKVPGVMDRMLEGIKGQGGSDPVRNTYMENLASLRKSKGWIKE